MSARPHITHVAIQTRDIDASIDFYQRYVGLHLVHDRCDDGVRVAWMSEEEVARLLDNIEKFLDVNPL